MTIVILTLLYVLSIGGLLLVLPWYVMSVRISPFVLAFQHLRLGVLADVLNAIILIAAFSVMAGAVFSANQILVGLSHRHEAPALVAQRTKKNPVEYGALALTAVGIGIFITLASVLPSHVYTFLISASSFFTFFTWFIMLVTFVAWRRRNPDKPVSKLALGKTIGAYLTMAVFIVLIVFSLMSASLRLGFYACLIMFAIVTIGYMLMKHHQKGREAF